MIALTGDPIDAAGLIARFTGANATCGAIVSFTGTVRDGGGVTALDLDHHPSFTEKMIRAIAADALKRFAIADCLIVHRFGSLSPGDPIVVVAAASEHRRSAFDAVDYMMDRLKTEAPLWKRESGPEDSHWIEARQSDISDRARWDQIADAD